MREGGARLRKRINEWAWFDVRNVHGANFEGAVPAAIVSAVGQGVGEDADVWWSGSQALEAAGVTVSASAGAGDEVWWEVALDQVSMATMTLHECFIENQ